MARVVAIAALGYLVLHFGLYALQRHTLLPLQTTLIGDLAPALLVLPQHGLRVLCAWYFGAWSIPIMAPTALVIFALHLSDPIYDPTSPAYLAVWATFLLSAPLSFYLLKACLAQPDNHMSVEWRMIMLSGLLSGMINVMALGLLQPPSAEGQEIMIWLVTKLTGYTLGVFVLLLAILLALRLTKRALHRIG